MGCATLRSFHMSKVGRGLPQSHMAGAWLHTQHGEKGASIDSHSGHSVLCVLDAPHVCGFSDGEGPHRHQANRQS